MKNVVVDRWSQDQIFIIGDTAHQFPPSGGYGLNQGVSDAFSLAWRLFYMLKNTENLELRESFEKERNIHTNFVSQCAQMNYEKFLRTCKSVGLNVDHCKLLQNIVISTVPSNFRRSIFSNFMSAGIFVSNLFFSDSLKRFLKEKRNHIKLIFPYLDYGLNFKNSEKNKIELYENFLELKDIKVEVGGIIPNYKILNLEFRMREFLKNIPRIDDRPIFYIIFKDNEVLSNLNKIKIFDNKLPLTNFEMKLIKNNIKYKLNHSTLAEEINVYIEELESYQLLVIRPDHIIEYLI